MGGQLILTAGRRCLLAATEVGGVAILIDAKSRASSKMVCLVRSGCPFGRATFTALATRNDSGCTRIERQAPKSKVVSATDKEIVLSGD